MYLQILEIIPRMSLVFRMFLNTIAIIYIFSTFADTKVRRVCSQRSDQEEDREAFESTETDVYGLVR